MFSGLTAASSRAAIVAPVVVVCLAAAAWYVTRDTHEPPESSPAKSAPPVIPRHLEAPRGGAEAIRGDATFAAAFERGIAAYNTDDVEAAADAFEEAVRLGPSEPEAHINLGLVYMRLKRPDDGLRELAAGAALERERRPRHGKPGVPPDDTGRDSTIRTHEDPGGDRRP